jgi:pSer/pThr/pTyr-binding forkhead associated (FHA) protein
MSNETLLRIRVSLKGRPIKAYAFDGETVSIGRDPDADVFLDNTGISRAHAKIARTHGGFELEDLNSANGTYLNDVQISKESLKENDVIRVGKFSLWITMAEDRRAVAVPRKVSPDAFQGTTVLSGDQLTNMISSSREHDDEPKAIQEIGQPEYAEAEAGGWQPNKSVVVIAMAIAFLLGSALGAGATTWLLRH